MSELIDRQALLDEIWKMRMNYQMMDDTHTADKIMHGLYRAKQAVKEAPTITASPWHRVEDELPEIGKSVLVFDSGYYWLATRTDDEVWQGRRYWKNTDGEWDRIENDMYWMPIEPPKEDA